MQYSSLQYKYRHRFIKQNRKIDESEVSPKFFQILESWELNLTIFMCIQRGHAITLALRNSWVRQEWARVRQPPPPPK